MWGCAVSWGPAAGEASLWPRSLSPPEFTARLFSTVSNEVPEHPCVSPVSNHVYERRLIEKYIAENGTDPINNQPLSEEQLIDIKGAWWPARVYSVLALSLRGWGLRGREVLPAHGRRRGR